MFKWENKIQVNHLTQGFLVGYLTHCFEISGLKHFILLQVINNRGTCKGNERKCKPDIRIWKFSQECDPKGIGKINFSVLSLNIWHMGHPTMKFNYLFCQWDHEKKAASGTSRMSSGGQPGRGVSRSASLGCRDAKSCCTRSLVPRLSSGHRPVSSHVVKLFL